MIFTNYITIQGPCFERGGCHRIPLGCNEDDQDYGDKCHLTSNLTRTSKEVNIEYRLRRSSWPIEPNWMGVWFQMNSSESEDGVIFMASKEFPDSVKVLS